MILISFDFYSYLFIIRFNTYLSINPFNVTLCTFAKLKTFSWIGDRHSVISCAISFFKPNSFMSSFTHSNQDFLRLPLPTIIVDIKLIRIRCSWKPAASRNLTPPCMFSTLSMKILLLKLILRYLLSKGNSIKLSRYLTIVSMHCFTWIAQTFCIASEHIDTIIVYFVSLEFKRELLICLCCCMLF